eukprot:CAMPEP_0182925148 /NCGR_PEP_ID=MMETSP0105_2-20130417/8252_1 /TAXON_ID=81532 ORGANISM="Acanthoeca-like sp., Strain 10tr" /NCGR_SAMPLE_ID=MMETSP0105_2 /ASSEMBLY_ACC=CAM_ASM_000205 /LENGTH=409 /DNA_ID=CAMNT_0025062981 /DNA_START=42 /DNA_END=1271 /DNA_ORIENTATION=+
MSLSEAQVADLNRAVHEYLLSMGLKTTAASLSVEAEMGDLPEDAVERPGMLEKKWTAVVRLQKKVMELESKCEHMAAEIAGPKKLGGKRDATSWIPRPPAKEVKGHRLSVTRVLFHPSFAAFVTASEDATMKIWDYESGDLEKTLRGHTNTVEDVAFDPKGKILASCSADMTIRLWDFEDFQVLKVLRGHEHNISSVGFTPDGEYVISASRDTTIRIWEVATGFSKRSIKGHDDWVRCAKVDPSGSLIASCGNDETVRVWAYDSGKQTCEMKKHSNVVEVLEWAPPQAKEAFNKLLKIDDPAEYVDGPFFATGARDKKIMLWNAGNGAFVTMLNGHDSWVRSLVFHPGGKLLLSGADDKTIRVWDLALRRCTKTIVAHNHFVQSIDMHPSAPYLVSGSVDATARIWECQ